MRKDYVDSVVERFQVDGTLHGTPQGAFVDMDETAVFFEAKVTRTVNEKGKRTVSIRNSGSNSARATVCLAAAADGTKLPPFIIFKGKPGAIIERQLTGNIDGRVIFAMQQRGWQNDSTMEQWVNQVWKPFVERREGESSLLLLDEFKCHKKRSIGDELAAVGTELELIPGGYTCVLQPMDVGVNKPFKDGMRMRYMAWAAQRLIGVEKVPVPDRLTVASWIADTWDEIDVDTIRKTFRRIGYLGDCVQSTSQGNTEEEDTDAVEQSEDITESDVGLMRIGASV